jgi:hypothetical protein
MSSKYIPPSLRNQSSEMPNAFNRPRKQNTSSYWAARNREEDDSKKRAAEAAEKKKSDDAKLTEQNFPSKLGGGKSTSWSGRKFNEVIGDIATTESKVVETPEETLCDLPFVPTIRRYTKVIEESYTPESDTELAKSMEPDEDSGWVTVVPKVKVRREKTLEEKYPEPEETVWDDNEEESCWDERGRKLRH